MFQLHMKHDILHTKIYFHISVVHEISKYTIKILHLNLLYKNR